MMVSSPTDDRHACAANVNVLALCAQIGGLLEGGDVWFLRGWELGEEQEAGKRGAGDAAADYKDVEWCHMNVLREDV